MSRRTGLVVGGLVVLAAAGAWVLLARMPVTDAGPPGPSDGPPRSASERSSPPRAALPTRTEAPAAPLQLAGTVTTTGDAPVQGAQVAFYGRDQLGGPGTPEPLHVAKTDADGVFALVADRPGIVRVVEGASPPVFTVDESRDDLHFQRAESCAVDVTVVDPQGEAVPGYVFGFSYIDDTMPAGVVGQWSGPYTTGSDGRYPLSLAPCAALRFAGLEADQGPLAAAELDSTLARSVRLELLPSVHVAGQVVAPDGQALEAGTVVAYWDAIGPHTAFGEDGAFQMRVPADREVLFEAFVGQGPSARATLFSPSPGAEPWPVTLTLPALRTVTARCPEDSGCTAEEAPECVWTEHPEGGTARRPSVRCAWIEEPPSFACPCGPESAELTSAAFDDVPVAADTSEVALVRPPSLLAQLPQVSVAGQARLMPGKTPCTLSFGFETASGETDGGEGECDSEGNLTVDLPVGIPLEVQVDQGERTSRVLVELAPGDTRLPDIEVGGSASLTVTLLDQRGEFVSMGLVTLGPPEAGGAGVYDMKMFGSAAGAHFPHLPAGRYAVAAIGGQSEADGPTAVVVELAEGEARELELTEQ